MRLREVEIEIARASSEAPHVDLSRAPGIADEHGIRREYKSRLAEAERQGKPEVTLETLGVAPGGLSIVASGKIMAQEVIRFARSRPLHTRRVLLCRRDPTDFDAFRSTVEGYLDHFLEELCWGPLATVDAIIELSDGVVVVERSNPPFGLALPGGFVDYGESLERAVRREAREETGLTLLDLRQFHTYSDPGRDPRFHTISTVFTARAEGTPRAGDDAAGIRIVAPADIAGLAFAFDHGKILADWLAAR